MRLSERRNPHRPVFSEIDLRITAQEVEFDQRSSFATHLVLDLSFASANWSLNNFANGGALSNGVILKYEGSPLLPEPLTTNHDLVEWADRQEILIDSAASKEIVLHGIFNLWEMSPNRKGFLVNGRKKFSVKIQDDLSAVGNHFEAKLKGWSV